MAQGPICIITPSGMICASSPQMTKHYAPGVGTCDPNYADPVAVGKAAKVREKMDETGSNFTSDEKDLIQTVVQLMTAVHVNVNQHFTIVHNK
jgi:hypothetical protein